jgi:hypothetical protein
MSADANVAAVRDFIERAWNAGTESVLGGREPRDLSLT